MNPFDFETDTDTVNLFKVVRWCLTTYFGIAEEKAVAIINSYYQSHKAYVSDDIYHHDQPFEVAVRMYYVMELNEDFKNYVEWRTRNGYNNPPYEYFAYKRMIMYEQ